ncbi:HAD hydrolase-like protein [Aneurinibacillus sp. Ricciae_BoGa-3]|uniref:HAD family hydrolase n=1 Tax=Aneurinibacillus sp. Ricciae_BoGa-3 TaxID=3022697 RepID=UPI002340D154|nr:HAD hydrolase-like protein [Aneurinibacillus sp. Ricciae_BoGa-3]WCK56555.1 HAD hydrolase-like protein [Aneurinibacillus sp. Ricciae_BoGa-3]
MTKTRGVIFDMDNTLLRSSIDFAGMKKAVADLLIARGRLHVNMDISSYTTSQIIEFARVNQPFTRELDREVWETVERFEKAGMEGAVLEDHVTTILAQLAPDFALSVLTNNARSAACKALEETGITSYFNLIAGREQMTALKPSPSGVHYILRELSGIPLSSWVLIGDSWIDGKAAGDAGIPYISYKASADDLRMRGVTAAANMDSFLEIPEKLALL